MTPDRFFIRGEIDIANASGLLTTLRSVAGQQPGELVVDCMDITFIDVAGIRALMTVHDELGHDGRVLRLVHPSSFLVRVLEILELTRLLGEAPTVTLAG